MYDVAVIGGGPAGSQVAYRLAGLGYEIVVIEQKEKIDEPVCCTGIISQECVRSFSINESVIYRWANSARIFSPSGKMLDVSRPQPQVAIVSRTALNKLIAERAKDEGAEYLLNSQVSSINIEGDGVKINVVHTGKDTAFLEARVVVIATGSDTGLIKRLGLGDFDDSVTGAQAEVETDSVDEVEVYLCSRIAPRFFAWLVPTSTGRALVGLMSRHKPGYYLRELISSLKSQGKIISSRAGISYGRIPLEPLGRTYGERLLVVGSAAGQVKPTTGGGIYYSLLCANIAADNLNKALRRNTLSTGSLADYEKEWKKKLGRELMIGYWARMLYEKLSDTRIDQIFDIIISKGIDKALLEADDLSFDWHSGSVLKLMGNRALSSIANGVKSPLPSFGEKK